MVQSLTRIFWTKPKDHDFSMATFFLHLVRLSFSKEDPNTYYLSPSIHSILPNYMRN